MNTYLTSSIKQFRYYKSLGDSALNLLDDLTLFAKSSQQENSIAIIVQHMVGNMLSRWTNIWTEDGEKVWRERDKEFEQIITNRAELERHWEKGWALLFETLESCTTEDLDRILYIRNMGHTLTEAINRQLCHYSYHIGQIVILSKAALKDEWKSLSIPLGDSEVYNEEKFSSSKSKKHFTDELLDQ